MPLLLSSRRCLYTTQRVGDLSQKTPAGLAEVHGVFTQSASGTTQLFLRLHRHFLRTSYYKITLQTVISWICLLV
ncbi:hypothetical protein llap_9086 [Limosa lapponica baueri]|uniref:Uncharacterized protein n=1 Tax=Limosa lapponica baueri TaxID=1758121 RepID=A0A2I0U3H1_LIMLA|nr:hypothetical protein llap_9086 [Limosa lapponica baueri]